MDINGIPRPNSSAIFDFQNSYVNLIYTAQPNPFAGALVVAGYLIITFFDVLILCWYIVPLVVAIYCLRYGTPFVFYTILNVFIAIWNYFDSRCFNVAFNVAEAFPGLPPRFPGEESPVNVSPAKKSPVRASPTKISLSDITPAEINPRSATAANSANASPLARRIVTRESPIREIFPAHEHTTAAAPARRIATRASSVKEASPIEPPKLASKQTTESAPARRIVTRASPIKETFLVGNVPELTTATAPLDASSGKTSPAKTSSVKTTHSDATPSTMIPGRLRYNIGRPELTTWFKEGSKLLLSTVHTHLVKVVVILLVLVSVLYYKSVVAGLASGGSRASVGNGSLLSDSRRTFTGFWQYVRSLVWSLTTSSFNFLAHLATWTNAAIFVFLIPFPILFSWVTGAATLLGLIAIAAFHSTLFTTWLPIFLVFLSSTKFFGLKKVGPVLILLIVSAFGYWGYTQCFNSALITAFSLVSIAILAWGAQFFVDFMKRTCPTVIGLPFSILTWNPVFWAMIFWIGRYHNVTLYSPVDQLRLSWNESQFFFFFLLLATFKFTKIFVHIISYYLWTQPVAPPQNPTIIPADVTVIVPTVGTFGNDFDHCIRSILANEPARVIVSTCGHGKHTEAIRVCEDIDPRIEVVSVEEPNKRTQLVAAVEMVRTPITIYADDHVFWPRTFLQSALAPFEDPIVGLVGTSKRVIRHRSRGLWNSFFNYIACIYLERHNFECTATYNIDGGVFVISGRTVLLRTSILHSLEYREDFQNEQFVGIGPLKVDDDNFNTRFMLNHGFKTVFHNDPRATITTTLVHGPGQLLKFRGQLLRWARTTWRSNLKSLVVDRTCYQRTPWTTYAMFFSSFVNFALFYDFGMLYLLWKSGSNHICAFVVILFLTKLVKPLPHLLRERSDWIWVIPGIVFGYAHSFIKAYACVTMLNVE